MNRIVLISGATSGFGKSTAHLLAQNGYRLIITGRRNEHLKELKEELETKYNNEVFALNFDVRDKNQVDEHIENLPDSWKSIDVLVNNAGLSVGLDPINKGVIDDWERMIDTNIKGLLYVTKKVIPFMVERHSGHIVNIGSIAGTQVYENGNVYCASKHAVHALSQAMRIDLLKHNIKVSEIRPGLAETEFSIVRFKGDIEAAKKPYIGLKPLLGEDIADAILYVISRPSHVNINDMEITPTSQASSVYVFREP